MTSPFDEARKGAVSTDQIRHEIMLGYLNREIGQREIANTYNEYEEHRFWEEFRILYQNAGDDKATFIERLEASVSGKDGGLSLNRGNATPFVNPKEATPIEPLPEPFVSGSGRGRSNAQGKDNPVVRTLRRIGRLFGIRGT